jgi:hypothetical protein
MVSSVLSPEKVIGRQNTNKAAAQNFISGGSVVGASVINGAANKIVGFQRTGAQPAPSATGSIVSTISTNINNNVTNTINKTLQGFSADYQNRIKQVDDAKPIGILGKFLNVYKTALGFINFFGNKRNIDNVRNNLDALKKSFTESFEVAKLIRQVIIKIVKQLSNLPVASPSGGGGLNLDVDIPAGGLKKSAPRGLGRMMGGKGKMLALGAGALGLGAAGASAVNALSDSPQAQAAGTSPEIPGDIGDKFSSIVDRFANVVSKLFNMKNEKSKGSAASGGGGQTSGGPGGPGGPGSPNNKEPTAGENYGSAGAEAVKNFAATQGYSPEFTSGLLATIDKESGFNPYAIGDSGNSYGLFQMNDAAGRRQPFLDFLEKGGVKNPKELFLNPNSERAKKEKDKVFNLSLEYMMQREQGTQIARDYSKSKDLRTIMGGFEDIEGYSGSQPVLPRGQRNNLKYNERLRTAQEYLKSGVSGTPVAKKGVGGPDLPDYMLPPEKRNQYKNLATNVSQPPPSQQQQQSVVMPIDLGGGGQQQTSGGGGMSGPPPSQGGGPSVPFLPAGNPDNFLVLYSRMVYNIVDG